MAPSAKMKVVDPPGRTCIGCEVLVQRDETNEQNINFHRQEMAERWRMQEEMNKAMTENVAKLALSMAEHVKTLNSSITGYFERVVKIEKSLTYVAIIVVVSVIATWGAKLIP